MAGDANPYAQIDFESLVNSACVLILIQAIQESIRAAQQEAKRAIKIAELKDKKVKLQANIEFYQGSLERNEERTARCLRDISAAEKRIAEGTATEKTHTNLKQSQENLSLVTARKEELDTKLANAERNLAKANKHIETLRAKSTLTAARETQKLHYIFFREERMPQKEKILTYSFGLTKGS
jgi:chromosome segregation ATPase